MEEKNYDARLLQYVAMYTRCTRDIDTTCYSFKNRGAHSTGVESTNKQIIRLLLQPWQQTIVKITIFWLFSTYLLPFLELASVKYLETRQSCENDFRQYFNLKK